jgi:hypothetical protein
MSLLGASTGAEGQLEGAAPEWTALKSVRVVNAL